MSARLDAVIAGLPEAYKGPGGAVAVVMDGKVLIRHAWGYANAERRIPFTPRTLFRICSISKQFTCGLAVDAFGDLSDLDSDVAHALPRLTQAPPRAAQLAHNQSGIRDYWALAMLHGSAAEADFGPVEAAEVMLRNATLQFEPGTRYSYCNHNFRLLGDIVAARLDAPLDELYRKRLFDRVGMESAFVAADARTMPDGAEGYEGDQASGFRPAINRIHWTGDAGLGASLDDMIAWERFIDAGRDDPDHLYQRLAAPVAFADGAPNGYGFGLSRGRMFDRAFTGHGGALRGWRSHRLYMPAERLSVVVLFNHLSEAHRAAQDIVAAMLDEPAPPPPMARPEPEWLGAYRDSETGISARIEGAGPGRIALRYVRAPEFLDLTDEGAIGADLKLTPRADGLWMDRAGDNFTSRLQRLAPPHGALDGAGAYHCAELDAWLTVENAGGALYGAFSGFLGRGRMESLDPIAADTFALPCPRALDHTPPGDWTLAFRRKGGRIVEVEVGCWLARGLRYRKV
jgi:D-aminopeptidase